MRTILIAVLSFMIFNAHAQELASLRKTKLETPEDYTMAKDKAMMAADHILNNPYNRSDKDRMISAQFLLKWTSKVPGYTFRFDSTAQRFLKEDNDLVAIYIASLVKHALSHPEAANNFDLLKWEGAKLFLEYCKIAKNNVQIRGEVKKALDAEANNKLPEYLELGKPQNMVISAKNNLTGATVGLQDSTYKRDSALMGKSDSIRTKAYKDSLRNDHSKKDSLSEKIKHVTNSENNYASPQEEVPEEVIHVTDVLYLKFDNKDSGVNNLKYTVVDYCNAGKDSKQEITTVKLNKGSNKFTLPMSDAILTKGNTGIVRFKDGKKSYYLVVKRD